MALADAGGGQWRLDVHAAASRLEQGRLFGQTQARPRGRFVFYRGSRRAGKLERTNQYDRYG